MLRGSNGPDFTDRVRSGPIHSIRFLPSFLPSPSLSSVCQQAVVATFGQVGQLFIVGLSDGQDGAAAAAALIVFPLGLLVSRCGAAPATHAALIE